MSFDFVARRPRPGQYLVSHKREQVLGRVVQVRSDRTLRLETPGGERHTTRETWEAYQYQPGEVRFEDEVPAGYTREGNGWSPERAKSCADCSEPASMLFSTHRRGTGWVRIPVCTTCYARRESARLAAFYEKHGGRR